MNHQRGCQPQRLAWARALFNACRRRTRVPAALWRSVGLAICAAFLWTTPAAAIPGLQFVSSATVADSASIKTTTIACPAGKKVYSAGGAIQIRTAGTGKVLLQQVFPAPDLSSVTVQAVEDGVLGFSGTWTVGAQAICGPPVANLHREKVSSPLNTFNGDIVEVPCTGSTVMYGTGFAIHGEFGGNGKLFADRAQRNTSGGAEIGVVARGNPASTPFQWFVDGFAICGASVPGYQVVNNLGAFDSNSPKSVIFSCPPPKQVHGSGFSLVSNDSFGDLILTKWNYGFPMNQAFTVDEDVPSDGFASQWRIGTFMVCANP
jgi:hypothetical protein